MGIGGAWQVGTDELMDKNLPYFVGGNLATIPSTFIFSATGRSIPAMVTDGTAGFACFNCCHVPTSRASNLSKLSCKPFCMYHSLTSDVHAASTGRPAAVLSARMARWSCVVSILVVLYAMPSYDVTHWTAVDGKQDGSQYESLRDADI